MIIGVIEIGSGTTRLQVADIYDDGTFRPRRVPKPNKYEVDLKMALDSGQASLLKTSMDELERGLRSLKEKAEAAGARRIGCFGTEAVRQINDKKLFDFNRLSSRLELPIHVLPSGGEAKLAFWAIAREPTLRVKSGENLVVVDLGTGGGFQKAHQRNGQHRHEQMAQRFPARPVGQQQAGESLWQRPHHPTAFSQPPGDTHEICHAHHPAIRPAVPVCAGQLPEPAVQAG